MKKIKLRLTGVGETLTQAAEKKLEQSEDYQVPTCKNGLTEEQYIDLGVKLPEDLVQKLKEQDKGVELEDQDFEEIYSDISIYNTDILFKVSDEEVTTIFVKGGYTLSVLETCDEIDEYEELMSRNWLEKIRDYFLFFFRRKKETQQTEIEFKLE